MLNVIDRMKGLFYYVTHFEQRIIPAIINLRENPKPYKKSGYLTIRRKSDGRVIVLFEIGDCPQFKAKKYFELSMEKGGRLFHHPGHVSSWQSRDPEKGRWGGAIATNELIVSFSGFTESLDEAAVLVFATFFGWISDKQAGKIAKISNNFDYASLRNRV